MSGSYTLPTKQLATKLREMIEKQEEAIWISHNELKYASDDSARLAAIKKMAKAYSDVGRSQIQFTRPICPKIATSLRIQGFTIHEGNCSISW